MTNKTGFLHISSSREDKLNSEQRSIYEDILSECGATKKIKEKEQREWKGYFRMDVRVCFSEEMIFEQRSEDM